MMNKIYKDGKLMIMVLSAKIITFPEKPRRVKPGPKQQIASFDCPVYAGIPDELPESFAEYAPEFIDLNEKLVDNPERTIIVPVRGDSMEPLLSDGDQVIVNESLRHNYKNNICVIYVNGSPTVKWVKIIKNKLVLVPENTENYKPTELDGSMTFYIAGVVTGMFREFRPRL
jgi:SOS-response transcriptional repressor LexA